MEDREELLVFLYQTKKQGLLGNWTQADTSLFVPFATFCENCLRKSHETL
jgi:hypothetical protein